MGKEQYLSKIASVIQGINYGKDTDEASLKRIANSLESVTKEQKKSIVEILSGGSGGGGCVSLTYAELKNLRDSGQLSPGTLYRITDYVATTTQQGTKSANHPFDIVVVALDEKTLSEDAGAIAHSEEDLAKYKSITWTYHSGTHTAPFLMETNITMFDDTFLCAVFAEDENTWVVYNPQYPARIAINISTEDVEKTEDGYIIIGSPEERESAGNYTIEFGYFANSNLSAWQLKYCLDNDTNRFAWAKAPIPATPADPGTYPATQVSWKYDPGSGIYRRTPDDDAELEGTLYYGWRYVNNSNRKTGLDDPTIQWESLSDTVYYTLTDYVRVGTSPFYFVVDGKIEPYGQPIIRLSSIPCPAEPGGKGVIYWMKDEHDNEAPFDFKGIVLTFPSGIEVKEDWSTNVLGDVQSNSYFYFLSVIDKDEIKDVSVNAENFCRNNICKPVSVDHLNIYRIPCNFIINNTFEDNSYWCYNNYFMGCDGNFIGNSCNNITLYEGARGGFITNQCSNITIKTCINYYIGMDCYNIDITDTSDAQITCENQVCNVQVLPGVGGKVIIPMVPIEQMRYVGVDSNNNLKIWNPADTAPQKS